MLIFRLPEVNSGLNLADLGTKAGKEGGKLLFIILVAVSVMSCNKDLCDCFTSTGPLKTEERLLDDFTSIRLEDNINLVLIHDSLCHARVEAGSNLIPKIHTEVRDGRITIRNTNACNWVRNLDAEIKVYLFYKTLKELNYNAIGDVSNLDTLYSDRFVLDIKDGAGTFNLVVNLDTANFNDHDGTADVFLSGKVRAQYIYYSGYGKFDAAHLASGFTYIHNRGTNDCRVSVRDELQARIENIGNIYYTGSPATIITWIQGKGNLIHTDP